MGWRWYVYEIVSGGAVIYVGKGCGRRAAVSARERGGDPEIIACFEHESAALDFERERIALRLAEGCHLQNITHGNCVSWWKRTDTQQMAIEVLQCVARRAENWWKAGRLDEFSKITGMPMGQLFSLIQTYGR